MGFSPDGQVLATAETAGTIKLWDAASGRFLASFKGHTGGLPTLCFFPDGQTLASAGDDRTVRLWDVVTGQELATLKGHKDRVTNLAIAADGHTLASASDDARVKLWRAATDAQAQAPATELDPEDADSPLAHERRGDQLWATGRPAEAESAYGTAANRWEQLAAAFPHRVEYQQRRDTTRLKLHVVRAGAAADGQAERAYERLLDLEPVNRAELHNLAWVLTTSPNPHGPSARWSVGLARRLVALAPRKANYWRTLGLAYYRAGEYEAAAAALQRPRELEFVDSAARFALALVHWRLGQREEAARWYRDGLAKMEDQEDDRDVRGLRDEAAELLGVKNKSDQPPFGK
jgi:hypothetical protein